MHYEQKKCPYCNSPIVSKDGKRDGRQRYKCLNCQKRFTAGERFSDETIWKMYQDGKQTVSQIAKTLSKSESTIKRRLRGIVHEWQQPQIEGNGVVHIDATYFGRNHGVLVAIESISGKLLYMSLISHERVSDYTIAVRDIESRGYKIQGIVIDGIQKLFKVFSDKPIQMCQYHMLAIVRRKLTRNPKLESGIELLAIASSLPSYDATSFESVFSEWKQRWKKFLDERTVNPISGSTFYTHSRLRSAYLSLEFYRKWLFTYQRVNGMRNTNNPIEGVFTDLKKKIRVHPGMSEANRKRFVFGFFLAYEKIHNTKKEG